MKTDKRLRKNPYTVTCTVNDHTGRVPQGTKFFVDTFDGYIGIIGNINDAWVRIPVADANFLDNLKVEPVQGHLTTQPGIRARGKALANKLLGQIEDRQRKTNPFHLTRQEAMSYNYALAGMWAYFSGKGTK